MRQIIDIATEDRHLRRKRGLLEVVADNMVVASFPIDNVQAVIFSAYRATLSKSLLTGLATDGITVLFTDTNKMPAVTLTSLNSHHETAGHILDQVAASAALQKRLWQKLVVAKLNNQAAVIEDYNAAVADRLRAMAKKTGSGDPQNFEAQGARLYWPVLMGAGFRRNSNDHGLNAFLNYGYAVVRAVVAQALVSSGLHPALGIHHCNRKNPFCLADDLIEPYRPVVDWIVHHLDNSDQDITPDIKRQLVSVLDFDLDGHRGRTPLRGVIQQSAASLAHAFREQKAGLLTLGSFSRQVSMI